jgi:hypothetical protein
MVAIPVAAGFVFGWFADHDSVEIVVEPEERRLQP